MGKNILNDSFDFFDSTPCVSQHDRYQDTKRIVAEIVCSKGKGKPADFVTLGRVSLAVPPECRWMLTAVLNDLHSDGVIRFNERSPAPTRIWKA